MSVTKNVGTQLAIRASITKQFADQIRSLILKSINGISRVLQKLLKFFNDTIILTHFVIRFSIVLAIFVIGV